MKGDIVEIVYIDFGNVETVSKEDVYLLPDEAFNFSFQVSFSAYHSCTCYVSLCDV